MAGWTEFFYFFSICVTLLLSVLGLEFISVMPAAGRWNRHYFQTFFIILILNVIAVFIDISLYDHLAPDAAMRLIQILECLLIVLPLIMLPVLLLHCCGESIRDSGLLKTVLGLWILYFILVISGLFTDVMFFVGADRLPHRGPWYPLMLLPVNGITLLNLAGTIRRRKRLSHKVRLSFLSAELPMMLAVIAQLFADVFLLLAICCALFALSMYSLILSEQIEQDKRYQQEIVRQQQEIAGQRSSIMVLKMRPHFIYNTLASIYCLCSQDPEKAQQVIMDFTAYLRQNFNAVASADPVPFTSELEHTKAYLAVEQAQYAKSLSIKYDTPHTAFRVPPLTLQPIVENAVKHGRNPDAGLLHVIIRTCHMDSASVITVEDNGPGFDPAENDKPHTTLTNIRQRLELMCGGKMDITPRDGGGTVVTLTIPDHGPSDSIHGK